MAASATVVRLFGPIAVGKTLVGKTSVGEALAQRTALTLLRAHMTIDLVTQFFGLGSDPFRRVNRAILHLLLQ